MAYTVTNNPWTSQYNVGIGIDSPTDSGTPSLEIRPSGDDAYTPTDFNNKSAIRIFVPNTANNYAGITFTHAGNTEGFLGLVKGATTGIADFVFQGYNGSAYQEHMRITAAGKVGIGTSAPSASLSVGAGASSVHGELLISADDGLHNYIRFTNGGAGESHYPTGIWYAPSGRMELRVADSSTTSNVAQLVLAANSNVGIGATSPSNPLYVKHATSGSAVIHSNADTAGTMSTLYFKSVNTSEANNGQRQKGAIIFEGDGSGVGPGQLYFCVDTTTDSGNAGVADSKMTISGSNVGIGTSAPASELHIQGTGAQELRIESDDQDALLVLDWDGTDNGLIIFKESGTEKGRIYMDGTNEDMHFKTAGTDRLVIEDGGNVGIGASSPSYKLEVAGTFYSAGSSATYKENIEDLEVDSSLIHSLRAVSYDYKKKYKSFGYDVKDGKQIGLISEEVAEIIPELAIMKDGKPMNVDYQKLAVVLLAEVQNLKKDIEELKK